MSESATRLGLRLLTADGMAPDPHRGVALIEQAAREGDAQAAYLSASIHCSNLWRPRNWNTCLDYLVLAAQGGYRQARESLAILEAGPGAAGNTLDAIQALEADWQATRERIDIGDWLSASTAISVREQPSISAFENFCPPLLCQWLVEQVRARMTRATIYDRVTGGATRDQRRTNSQCDLGIEEGGSLGFLLRARISLVTGRPEQAMEIPKVLHYLPGETFEEHGDYLDPVEPVYARELAERGQRSHTFLIYLNDDYSGGETRFTRIELDHRGACGDALLFRNTDEQGAPDRETTHAGMPTVSGEKWLFSQWIRNRP